MTKKSRIGAIPVLAALGGILTTGTLWGLVLGGVIGKIIEDDIRH